MRKNIVLFLALIQVVSAYGQIKVCERWSKQFTSDKNYANPYSDITIKAVFTGPGNAEYEVYGYWTGGQNYEISFCFPVEGTWNWKLSCSDSENKGLNNNFGSVDVKKYNGSNKLYQNGFLKVSENRRYLAYNNNIPFLWMGCTAWVGPVHSSFSEWKKYVDDRAKKHFSVIQITPFHKWGQKTNMKNPGDVTSDVAKNMDGEVPFTEYFDRINPAYWLDMEKKIQYANEKGLVIVLIGIPGWQFYFENFSQQKTFARYLTGLLAGNFVIYSPSSDRPYSAESDGMAMILDSLDSRHLITQHPGTPSGKQVNIFAEEYYNKPYLDFSMCQSGHNGGRRDLCIWNAVHWNLSLYRREPHKPVINGEAFYHGGNINASEQKYRGTDTDARSLGWYSWLSGAMGYTYGALGIWNWGLTTGDVFIPWREAMKLNSSYQMKYMTEFFENINWWELSPDTSAILNQPQDTITRMAFAKNEEGTLAVAYLPNNSGAEINMEFFKSPVKARWFNPRNNRSFSIHGEFENRGSYFFNTPANDSGDWVLLMQCK